MGDSTVPGPSAEPRIASADLMWAQVKEQVRAWGPSQTERHGHAGRRRAEPQQEPRANQRTSPHRREQRGRAGGEEAESGRTAEERQSRDRKPDGGHTTTRRPRGQTKGRAEGNDSHEPGTRESESAGP